MKLWTLIISSAAFLLILSGCGVTPKPKEKVVIDNSLPIVKLTQSGTFIDMNAIAFEWSSIEDERVEGIYIYKQTIGEKISKQAKVSGPSHYKTINNRFATHFVDRNVKPDTGYIYSFKTFSKEAESKMSKEKVINSLPVLQSVVWIKSIPNMPRTAKIIWRPHTNQKVKSYLVERRTLAESKWKRIAKIDGRLSAEFIDMNLKDSFVYKYRVRVLTFDGIISTPSDIVKVVTKKLPISIKNINATTDLPKKIDITWEKSTTEDFARYYLYRAEKSNGSYKLIAKLYNNRFTDSIDEDGKEFFYRVSAVEKDGLESIYDRISVQGVTLVKPATPTLAEARLIGGKIEISWNPGDKRAKSFTVIKKVKTGWFDAEIEEFVGITGNKFIDAEIGPNITYYYKVYASDKYSIKSKPSIEIEITTPKTIANNVKKVKKVKQMPSDSKTTSQPQKKSEEVTIIPMQDFN